MMTTMIKDFDDKGGNNNDKDADGGNNQGANGNAGISLEWPNWQMGMSILLHSSTSWYLFI